MKNEAIVADKLTIRFGKQVILDDITFTIQKGEFAAIVGPNGSGKTTILKAMLGLVPASSGSLTINSNLRIGYLPQKVALQDRLFPATANEIVAMGILMHRSYPKVLTTADHEEIARLLNLLKMKEFSHTRIGLLSGGQQQRIMLARALATHPDILVLDEPTSALDPQIRADFYVLLKQLNEVSGVTIVLVSHDVASLSSYATRIIYLDQRLLFNGTMEQFCETTNLSPFIHTHPHHHDVEGKGE